MVFGGEKEIVCCTAFLGVHHCGDDAACNTPLATQVLPISLPRKSCRDNGNSIEIGHADIFECYAAASPPQPLR
jgi:hypothetical protein